MTLNIPYNKNQREKFHLVTESGPVDIIVDKNQAVNRLYVRGEGDPSDEESDLKCPENEEESMSSAEEVVPDDASKWVEVKQSKSSITEFVKIFTKTESHDASIKIVSASAAHHQPQQRAVKPRRETASKVDKATRALERNKRKVEKRKLQRQVRVPCFQASQL